MTYEEAIEWLRGFIAARHFRFAKTMPRIPHWYTVRANRNNVPTGPDPDFEKAVSLIREFGERRRWGRYRNIYLEVDGWRYWTMGAPVEQTVIINREKVE